MNSVWYGLVWLGFWFGFFGFLVHLFSLVGAWFLILASVLSKQAGRLAFFFVYSY